jgi:MinD-like ATPase involved in chromosome partitioning or flagellar assembly
LIYVPNKVRNTRNGQNLFDSMNKIAQKFLGASLNYIGSISYSSDYNQAWTKGVPAVTMGQSAIIERDYEDMIEALKQFDTPEDSARVRFFS